MNISISKISIISILLLFGAFEIYLFEYHFFPSASAETDGFGYMERASGNIFQLHPFHWPGYSLGIRVVGHLGFDPFAAGKLVSIVSGVVFIFSCWIIFSNLVETKFSILATFIVAFNPLILHRSITLMSDMMAAALFTAVIAFFVASNKKSLWYFLLAGATAGLAILTRSVFVILFVMPLLAMFTIDRKLYRFKHYMMFYLGVLIITFPWFYFLYQNTGNPLWNHNHLNIAFKMHTLGQGWNAFPKIEEYSGLREVILSDPVIFTKTWIKELVAIPYKLLFLVPTAGILCLIGFFHFTHHLSSKVLLTYFILAIYGAVISLVWIEDRFLIPFILIISIYASLSLSALSKNTLASIQSSHFWLYKISEFLSPQNMGIVAIIAVFLFSSKYSLVKRFSGHAPEYQEASEWLKKNVGEGDSVMSSKPHFAFFSDAKYMDFRAYNFQNVDRQSLLSVLSEENPTYLVYDERYAFRQFPNIDFLLGETNQPSLELVYTVQHPKKINIYKYIKKP